MENQERKSIDDIAKRFIISAYKLGISTLLIDRFLRESNYNCTMIHVHDTLWSCDIIPDNYNCSSESLTWRRFLTSILDDPEVDTLRKFESVALQEAVHYYNIDETIFTNYWHEFNDWTRQMQYPLDTDWIMHGAQYFGFTFIRLSDKLFRNNIEVSPTALWNQYNDKLHSSVPNSSEDIKLRPKTRAWPALREFWILSHRIGKENSTILDWTEIFTGTGIAETEIETVIQQYIRRR